MTLARRLPSAKYFWLTGEFDQWGCHVRELVNGGTVHTKESHDASQFFPVHWWDHNLDWSQVVVGRTDPVVIHDVSEEYAFA